MAKNKTIKLKKSKIQNKYYDFHYYNTDKETFIYDDTIHGAGGGGSCFPAGTFVRTQTGYNPIENVREGDVVLAYDRFGEIEFGVIQKVNTHTVPDIKDDLFDFNDGFLVCTGNHALYDYKTNEHRLAHDFKVGDSLTDMSGKQIKISNIKRTSFEEFTPDFTVYNFEIYPQHTFLVSTTGQDWVKVHNGGGGGSKNAQPRPAQEAPNTLRSNAVVRVLEVLSEGEIVGVVGGAKGVKLNATPIQNPDDTYNFKNISFAQRYGIPDQTYIPGFTNIQTEQNKQVDVKYAAPVTQSVIGSDVDAAVVTLSLPEGLWSQDTTTGDLNGYSVSYAIDVRVTAGSWVNVVSKTLSGKCTTAYEFSHRVQNPSTGGWDIRVRRLSADDSSASKKSNLRFARWTEIQEIVETYPNTAYVGLTVSSESVGNQIPTRSYDVQGIKVKIPSNYNPTTRVFTGTWDGTFNTDWTDDPAWILYDLITNTRYGVATYMNQTISVDKWEFYNCSVYNNQLVPDGKGGYEARFTFNSVIQQQSDAWQLLHAVASTMRCNIGMNGNQVTLVQDRPTTSAKILTNANVIDGIFTYAGTDAGSRTTAVNITFNDKNDFYLPRTISLENNDSGSSASVNYGNGMNKWGYNVQDYVAFGAVTESQALRMARWVLYSEAYQYDIVSFGLALNSVDVGIGDVVTIMDNDYISDQNKYLAGRVASVNGTTITLSNEVTIDSGYTYKIGITNLANTDIIERTITSAAGTSNVVTIDSALPTGDYTNKEFFCYSSGHIEPRLFKIIAIAEQEKGIYSYTAHYYDKNKWDIVESGLTVAPPPYSTIDFGPIVKQPINTLFTVRTWNDPIYGKKADLLVSWDCLDNDVVDYIIRWRREDDQWSEPVYTSVKDYTIQGIKSGTYSVGITSVRVDNRRSIETVYTETIDALTATILPPINLYIKDTTGVVFTGKEATFTWEENGLNATLRDATTSLYYIEIRKPSDDSLVRVEFVQNDTFSYTYTQSKMNADNFVSRSFVVRLYAVDSLDRKSATYITKTFSNPVPSAVSLTVTSNDNTAFITLQPGPDSDIEGFTIHRSTTDAAFTPDESNKVYDGPDRIVTLSATPATTYYYKAAAYDIFDKIGLNYSSTYTNTTTDSTSIYEFIYNGIEFSISGNVLSWTTGTVEQSYSGTKQSKTISAGDITWTTGTMYVYYTWGGTTLSTTTSYQTALTIGNDILAIYKGGNDIQIANGKPIINGNQIIAQSIGANQLSSGLLITNTAQIDNAIITGAKIVDATIDTLQLKYGSVSDIKTSYSNNTSSVNLSITVNAPLGSTSATTEAIMSVSGISLTTPNPPNVTGVLDTTIFLSPEVQMTSTNTAVFYITCQIKWVQNGVQQEVLRSLNIPCSVRSIYTIGSTMYSMKTDKNTSVSVRYYLNAVISTTGSSSGSFYIKNGSMTMITVLR